jgi:hypothetical protein
MLSRKHFQTIADGVAGMVDREAARLLAEQLIPMCRQSNPQFNESKFRAACGLTEGSAE